MFDKIYVVLEEVLQYDDENYRKTGGYEIVSCHYTKEEAEIERIKTRDNLKKQYETYDLYDFVCWEDEKLGWDSEEFLKLWNDNKNYRHHGQPLDEFVIINEYEIK